MRPLRTKLVRDLRRQKVQFGAVAVTVFLGITLFVRFVPEPHDLVRGDRTGVAVREPDCRRR